MVFEHDVEEEIREDKEESKKELALFLDYEGANNWLAGYLAWEWAQDLMASYLVWKVRKKWRTYKIYKMLKNVQGS